MDKIVIEIAHELIAIRQNSRLTGELKRRAKALLTELKRRGYSGEQVEAMTQGLWKASTVRAYTKGISAEDSSEPQELMQALAEMVRLGNTGELVKQANSIEKIANANNTSIERLSHDLATIGSTDLNTVVGVVEEAARKKIPLHTLPRSLAEVESLNRMGIDNKKQRTLYDLITTNGQGDFDKTVELVKICKKIEGGRLELDKQQATEIAQKARIDASNSELRTLNEEINEKRSSHDRLRRLEARGYDDAVLAKLEEASKRYGGPGGTLDGILKHVRMQEIEACLVQIQNKNLQVQSNFDKLQADYSHMIFEISLCKELLNLGYSPQAIEQITLMARKHGHPVKVMEILYQFDSVASIKAAPQKAFEYDKMKQQLDNANRKIEELKPVVTENADLKRDASELRKKLEESEKRWIRNIEEIIIQLPNAVEERKYPEELSGSAVLELIEKAVEQAVSDRLSMAENRTLRTRFEDVMKEETQKILTNWPSRELGKITLEKTRLLRQLYTENPFIVLKGEWLISQSFSDCRHIFSIKTVRDVRDLLVKGQVTILVSCWNNMPDMYHELKVSLHDVARAYIRKEVMRPTGYLEGIA
jgi:hypothetical protein